jgi:hypothetical protein
MTKRFRPWDPKAQRNFTDPESRIMPTKDGFQQCYNAQAGVDVIAQIIVACSVGNSSADSPQYEVAGVPHSGFQALRRRLLDFMPR